jgi:hypothetical protein
VIVSEQKLHRATIPHAVRFLLVLAALLTTMCLQLPAFAAGTCVAEASGFGASQKGCTSNDVEIAGVSSICVSDGQGGCQAAPKCIEGQDVTFSANFQVKEQTGTTGGNQSRYDVGLYFSNDGDPDGSGAFRGSCSVHAIGTSAGAGFVNLDSDTCGDIDPLHNPLMVPLTITTKCAGVVDPNDSTRRILKLPACTTWKVPGGNTACSAAADGSSPTTATASSSSKCKCQPGFTIAILVETPTVTTTKNATPSSIDEGSTVNVTFDVSVKNNGLIAISLEKLTDDVYGDVNKNASPPNTGIVSSTCDLPKSIAAGATYACSFIAQVVAGNAFVLNSNNQLVQNSHKDTVCASGHDTQGSLVGGDVQTNPPSGYCDDAIVTVNDVPATATIAKNVTSLTADVTYRVIVSNTSTVDSLSLNKLCDNQFGDLTGGTACGAGPFPGGTLKQRCQQNIGGTLANVTLPIQLDAGASLTCSFVATITASNTDRVTGTLTDNDGNTLTKDSNDATVTITTGP